MHGIWLILFLWIIDITFLSFSYKTFLKICVKTWRIDEIWNGSWFSLLLYRGNFFQNTSYLTLGYFMVHLWHYMYILGTSMLAYYPHRRIKKHTFSNPKIDLNLLSFSKYCKILKMLQLFYFAIYQELRFLRVLNLAIQK